ncbi:hypothetical protein MMC25_005624 [Agyrium rufum]|nr:hypothetical protein [Agyrium rufum]
MTDKDQSHPSEKAIEADSTPVLTKEGLSATQEAISLENIASESIASPEPLQKWNDPGINVFRVVVASYGLLIMGMNDGAYGALIPYLEAYYLVSYTKVSLIFLSPLIGYTFSALLMNTIHMNLGRRGIAFIAPSVRLIAYIVMSQHPDFGVLVFVFILAGFGNGLEDAAWNAWMGNMQRANEILGFLHGAYGLGAVLSPLIATTMITKDDAPWWQFYYIMVSVGASEAVLAIMVFWGETGAKYRRENPIMESEGNSNRTKEALLNRTVWICAAFLFVYVGIEVAIGGWIVVFMRKIRGVSPFAAGMAETGFWVGITVGRLILGFVTGHIGEKLAILTYAVAALGLHLILYLVPVAGVSFATVALEGFFLGPFFPAAVVATTKLLPAHLHVSGVGFAAAMGAAGACILPFVVGAIANAKGVQVLMPIVLAALAVDGAVWALLPGQEGHRKGWRAWLGIKSKPIDLQDQEMT